MRGTRAVATRREPFGVSYYVILVLFALGPLVVLAFNALKTSAEIGRNPLGPPLTPVFQDFPTARAQVNFDTTMLDSAILTVVPWRGCASSRERRPAR